MPGAELTPTLQKYCTLSNGVYFNDKIIKCLGYTAGCLADYYVHVAGNKPDSDRVAGLRAICSWMGFARYASRVPNQLTDSVDALINDSWAGPWRDKRVAKLARWQAVTNVCYHVMEHPTLCAYIAPKLLPSIDPDKWTWVSCWFWVAFVVLELRAVEVRLAELRRREQEAKALEAAPGSATAAEAHDYKSQLTEIRKLRHFQQGQRLRFWLFLPNAVHWSWGKQGLLPDWAVNLFGIVEGFYGTWLMWHHS